MMKSIRRRLARPFRNKAKLAQSQAHWTDALANLMLAASFDRGNPAILLQIANMRTELRQFEEAETSFKTVAEHSHFAMRASVGLAGLAERAFDWEAASRRWERVLELMAQDEGRPKDDRPVSAAFALLHSALCRERIGDGSGADRDLGLAIALDPHVRHEREAYLIRARITGYKDPRGAYRLLRAAHDRYPTDRTILFELTLATIRTGDRREAAAYARSLLASEPEDPGALGLVREHKLVLDDQGVG